MTGLPTDFAGQVTTQVWGCADTANYKKAFSNRAFLVASIGLHKACAGSQGAASRLRLSNSLCFGLLRHKDLITTSGFAAGAISVADIAAALVCSLAWPGQRDCGLAACWARLMRTYVLEVFECVGALSGRGQLAKLPLLQLPLPGAGS